VSGAGRLIGRLAQYRSRITNKGLNLSILRPTFDDQCVELPRHRSIRISEAGVVSGGNPARGP
jgi:hypothetical protein